MVFIINLSRVVGKVLVMSIKRVLFNLHTHTFAVIRLHFPKTNNPLLKKISYNIYEYILKFLEIPIPEAVVYWLRSLVLHRDLFVNAHAFEFTDLTTKCPESIYYFFSKIFKPKLLAKTSRMIYVSFL